MSYPNADISFPGLFGDWRFTLSPKLLDIGNGIYWYGILIALGMLLALWWCMRQRTKYGIREDDLIDGLLWGIPSAIVGARLYYVLFYLSEFKDHEGHFSWSKAIAIWDGGLAIYGGVIAVVPGIAGAVHTGGTVQGVDTQAGVIRHGGQTTGLAERFGLDAGILGKGSAGLLGVEIYT